jgi:PilZ domain
MSEVSPFVHGDAIAAEIEALERRIAERHGCHMLASCFLDPTRELLWGSVRNISAVGIGVVMDRALEPGTRMLVQVRKAKDPSLIALAARVIHSTSESPGKWTVGCRFVGDLANADLRALLTQ